MKTIMETIAARAGRKNKSGRKSKKKYVPNQGKFDSGVAREGPLPPAQGAHESVLRFKRRWRNARRWLQDIEKAGRPRFRDMTIVDKLEAQRERRIHEGVAIMRHAPPALDPNAESGPQPTCPCCGQLRTRERRAWLIVPARKARGLPMHFFEYEGDAARLSRKPLAEQEVIRARDASRARSVRPAGEYAMACLSCAQRHPALARIRGKLSRTPDQRKVGELKCIKCGALRPRAQIALTRPPKGPLCYTCYQAERARCKRIAKQEDML